ncbi:hypothetical protein GCM10009676_17590 [Prauserella halophila]|uniref:Prevent-host-death family protein n=1 Tax=Prauserella halophila TaxID=185641 RepID=A0ABP4GQX3_9PSEU|nr:hypothetical protein [Prauserella halophila]MCP2236040.1 hypothetical protein [Prauserella halophila]
MASVLPEVNYSELSRASSGVADKVEAAPGRAVRIRRRDAADGDLVLKTEEREREEHEVMSATTSLFVAMMRDNERARSLLVEVVPTAFPWVRFLPREDVQAFVVELVETLESAEGIDQNPAPVLQVINEWRNTANIWADPELVEQLNAPVGDFGPVSEPQA